MSPPDKENKKKNSFKLKKKKTGNVSPELAQCHKPSGL